MDIIKLNIRENIQWAVVEAETPRLAFVKAKEVNPKIQVAKSYFMLRPNEAHTIEKIEEYVNPPFEDKQPLDQPKSWKAAGMYALENNHFFVYVDELAYMTPTPDVTLDLRRAHSTLRSVIKSYEKGTMNEKSISALKGLAAIIKLVHANSKDRSSVNIEDDSNDDFEG